MKQLFKTLTLLLFMALIGYGQTALGSCNASFTKSISGLTVTFNNTSTGSNGSGALVYNWTFSDGTTSMTKNPVKTFATPGIKTANLTILDTITLCSSSQTDTFILAPPSNCAADFTKTANGLTVIFNNTSYGANGSIALFYNWVFSDGTTSTAENPVKTFASSGVKTARLTIFDSINACSSSRTDTFVLTPPSICAANFTKTINGLTVTFNNTSNGSNGSSILLYNWVFSDGTTSTAENPVKTFASSGVKTARLTIFDSINVCSSSRTDTFVLAPPAACTANFTRTISGLTVTFNNTSTGSNGSGALVYNWTFSDGTTSTAKNPVKTFASSGVKTARLTIFDSINVCSSSKTDTFVLVAPSTCAANFTRTISGLTVTFNNTSTASNGSGTLLYNWVFSDGTTSTAKNPVKTFASSGVKTARLTIFDSINVCSSSRTDTFVLAATSACAANFTRTISGLTVTFNNTSTGSNGSGALVYNWTFSDGTTSMAKNPVKTFATSGIKTANLTILDTLTLCSSSKTDTFVLASPPVLCRAQFSLAIDTSLPFNFFILNTSIVRPGTTYFWSFGDGNTSTLLNPTHTYTNFGMYNICLTITDSLCTSTFCDSVGMDSTGLMLKSGGFGFRVLNLTTPSTVTGVSNIEDALNQVKLFPNPVNDELHVQIPAAEYAATFTIKLSDMTGKKIAEKIVRGDVGNDTQTFEMSDLKPSLYLIEVSTDQYRKTFKVLKN